MFWPLSIRLKTGSPGADARFPPRPRPACMRLHVGARDDDGYTIGLRAFRLQQRHDEAALIDVQIAGALAGALPAEADQFGSAKRPGPAEGNKRRIPSVGGQPMGVVASQWRIWRRLSRRSGVTRRSISVRALVREMPRQTSAIRGCFRSKACPLVWCARTIAQSA